MNFLNNLSLHKKIMITPIVTTIFLIIISIFAYSNLLDEKNTIYDLVKVKMHTVEHNTKTTEMIRLINGEMYKIYNLKSAHFQEKEIANIEKKVLIQLDKLDTYLTEIDRCPYVEKKNKIIYKDICNIYKIYKKIALDSLDIMKFNVSTAFMLFAGSDELYLKIVNLLKQSSAISNEQSIMAYKKSMNDVQYAMILLFSLILIALVISLFMSIKVADSIKEPLSNLQNGLLEFFQYLSGKKDDIKPIEKFYNDEIGEMSSTINKNIIKIKSDLEMDNKMINELIDCVSTVNDGYLNTNITQIPNQSDLKRVRELFNSMLLTLENKIGKDINKILKTLDDYQNHNYNSYIDNANANIEIAVNNLGQTIRKMLKQNLQMGEILENKASILYSNLNTLEKNTTKQKELVKKSSSQVKEINKHIEQQVINGSKMATYSSQVTQSANIGKSLANKTTKAMETMNMMVNEINKSIEVIDQIVVQTNILSLNASVEAVSAGEAGKGFSVVAQEVRNLASKSSDASQKIRDIVDEAKLKANEGKEIVYDMIDGYNQLMENISKSTTLINKNISISNEQDNTIQMIKDMMQILDEQSNKTSTIVQDAHFVADETSTIAKKIVCDVKEHSF